MYKFIGDYQELVDLGFQKTSLLGQAMYIKGDSGKWSIVIDTLIGMATYRIYTNEDTPEIWKLLVEKGLIVEV